MTMRSGGVNGGLMANPQSWWDRNKGKILGTDIYSPFEERIPVTEVGKADEINTDLGLFDEDMAPVSEVEMAESGELGKSVKIPKGPSPVDDMLSRFAGVLKDKDNQDIIRSVAGGIGDMFKQSQLGELAAVEAATAPFAKGSIVDAFKKTGDYNLAADIAEGEAIAERRKERDRLAKQYRGISERGGSLGADDYAELSRRRSERIRGGK